MSEKIRVHVHSYVNGGQYCFLAGAIPEIVFWLDGYSRKPLYAINVRQKEIADGSSPQEER